MKLREDTRSLNGNICGEKWNTERPTSVNSKVSEVLLSFWSGQERRSLSNESQPNKWTDSVSKRLSKNWSTSTPFETKHINTHTHWYTWVFDIFILFTGQHASKKSNARSNWVRKRVYWVKANETFTWSPQTSAGVESSGRGTGPMIPSILF